MYENSNGCSSQGVKWTNNVTGRFCVEPVDCVAFADYNKSLKRHSITESTNVFAQRERDVKVFGK